MKRFGELMKYRVPRELRIGDFPFSSVFYILGFSIVFLTLYQPFSSSAWFSLSTARLAGLTILFFVISVILLLFSKYLFVMFCRKRSTKLWQFIVWSAVEFVAIALLYVGFTMSFKLGHYDTLGMLILKTIPCVALILLIPYSIIFVATDIMQSKLEAKDAKINAENPAPISYNTQKNRMVSFVDDSGALKFSVDVDSVLYIKSEGNYVNLFYEKGETVASYLMRTTIGSLELRLAKTPLLRCQRSYIVNMKRVRMMQNDGKSMYIILDNDNISIIPVSQTYAQGISKALTGIEN